MPPTKWKMRAGSPGFNFCFDWVDGGGDSGGRGYCCRLAVAFDVGHEAGSSEIRRGVRRGARMAFFQGLPYAAVGEYRTVEGAAIPVATAERDPLNTWIQSWEN